MEDILASVKIESGRSIHIAQLSRQTIVDAEAEHLGFGGYFLFETVEECLQNGINILGKVASIDAAFRMIEIMSNNLRIKQRRAANNLSECG